MPAAVIEGEHRPVGDYHGDISQTHDLHPVMHDHPEHRGDHL
jgi:hypothetical protein